MEVDPDVAGLLESMTSSLSQIRARVQAPLAQLNEDVVASSYSVDEQAKISLAAAFTLVMSYYCYKRLRNETIDAQLKLKVERVSEYVKKLREISERERLKALGEDADQPAAKKSRIDKAATDRLVKNAISVNERKVRAPE